MPGAWALFLGDAKNGQKNLKYLKGSLLETVKDFFWHTPVTGSLWQLRGWHHLLSEGWAALMWKNITSSWMDKNSLVGTSSKLPNSCISERLLDVFSMLDLTY